MVNYLLKTVVHLHHHVVFTTAPLCPGVRIKSFSGLSTAREHSLVSAKVEDGLLGMVVALPQFVAREFGLTSQAVIRVKAAPHFPVNFLPRKPKFAHKLHEQVQLKVWVLLVLSFGLAMSIDVGYLIRTAHPLILLYSE